MLRRLRPIGQIPERLGDTLSKINMQWVFLICTLTLVLQIINLVDPRFYEADKMYFSAMGLAVFCIVYMFIITVTLAKKQDNLRRIRYIYASFWVLLGLCMLPYYRLDMETIRQPMNLTLFYAALVIAPIFSVKDLVLICVVQLAASMGVMLWMRAGASLLLYTVAINAGGFVMSSTVHSSYLRVIAQLQTEANTDYLTQVFNRKAGFERIHTLWEVCSRMRRHCAVLAVDIDFFKAYNDTYGHYQGDVALKEVACCMQSCFERATDIICRTGGEEFVACFSVNREEDAVSMAQKLRAGVLALGIANGNKQVSEFLSISVGVAVRLPRKGENEMSLLQEADQALYMAKEKGHNCVAYRGQMVSQTE